MRVKNVGRGKNPVFLTPGAESVPPWQTKAEALAAAEKAMEEARAAAEDGGDKSDDDMDC